MPLVVITNEVLLDDSDANLCDRAIEVTLEVNNIGSVTAKEVVQVCITCPDSGTNHATHQEPAGSEKGEVKSGRKSKVTIGLTTKDRANWNTERQGWEILKGNAQCRWTVPVASCL